MNSDFRYYSAFGMRIASQFKLPGLSAVDSLATGVADVQICSGTNPDSLAGARLIEPRAQVTPTEALLEISGVARFHLRQGREVIVEAARGGSDQQLGFFLLGYVLGVLIAQRGRFAIHASGIEVNGRCVAFVGRKTAGKSTLAAHFQGKGYPVIFDDAAVIGFEQGLPVTWPGVPQLKLLADALDAFGMSADALEPVPSSPNKYYVPTSTTGVHTALPLDRIYLLGDIAAREVESFSRLTGQSAFAVITEHIHGCSFHRHIGGPGRLLEFGTKLVSGVPLYRADLKRGFDIFDTEAARLERHFLAATAHRSAA